MSCKGCQKRREKILGAVKGVAQRIRWRDIRYGPEEPKKVWKPDPREVRDASPPPLRED